MKNFSSKYSGVLLAGGKSSRMGEDKAFMKFNNRYLFEYSLSVLQHFSENIVISSSDSRFTQLQYNRIEDEIPDLGPLGGIYSCL
jgi:molybdenum cofactor guanylyltransferase